MSCPDWGGMALADPRRESDAWSEALKHYDTCKSCREAALAVDPLLVFRSLPAAELSGDEIDSMRKQVAGARRLRESERQPRTLRRAWLAASVALVLLVGWTVVGLSGGQSGESEAPSLASVATSPIEVDALEISPWIAEPSLDHRALPLFEEIEEPYQQVVQWSDEDVSVVLVVDDRFDV